KVTQEAGGYSYTYYSDRRRFASFDKLANALARIQKGRPYLIQRGIELARISGRPIDYRVKYVKQGNAWVIRAMVGRLARHGLFVTNLCRGGSLLPASQGIARSLS